jgi:hypothetical protein
MTTIELPEVGAPARLALQAAGVTTLGDLVELPESTVAALHGMGPAAMGRLRAALAAHGLHFADTAADAEGHPS